MSDYQTMSLEELLVHYYTISGVLLEKVGFEARLGKPRQPYPVVKPRFQNPNRPFQTWSGRGRQPRWVVELLATGKSLEDLRIR